MDRVGEHDDATSQGVATSPVRGDDESRFPIDVPGYQGTLEDLLRRAQRGDIDLTQVSVSAITDSFRMRLEGAPARPEMRDVADFLTLVARLVSLKASAVLPDQPLGEELEPEEDPGSEAGRRLAEYRLFKAAAEALLADAADTGARSFLGIVSPEVIPIERMRIPPERLAAAFRTVLERLAEAEPLPVGAVTFSVEEKVAQLRARLAQGACLFEDLFTACASRLEAVACFLALLELLRLGEATVDQRDAVGPITVTGRG
jgi:segregation and condensation protein A